MQAVVGYRPQPVGGDVRSATPSKSDFIYLAVKQMMDQQIAAHRDRLSKGVRLAASPNVVDMAVCDRGSTVVKGIIQIRKDQVLQYVDGNIDSKINQLLQPKKTTFSNLLSEVVSKISQTEVFCSIIFTCEPEANRNLFNSKLIKTLTHAAL